MTNENERPPLAMEGKGWIVRNDGVGSIKRPTSQIKKRPAPPAPIVKTVGSLEPKATDQKSKT